MKLINYEINKINYEICLQDHVLKIYYKLNKLNKLRYSCFLKKSLDIQMFDYSNIIIIFIQS